LDRRLYLPQKWFDEDHQDERTRCGIPEDVTFATKKQLATEMIDKVLASGDFHARWIGCDGAFGSDHNFRAALPPGYWFFADVHANQLVWRNHPQWVLPEFGLGQTTKKSWFRHRPPYP